jgi:hypothetical protein
MKLWWISFYGHLEMSSPFEQLPVELLEPMMSSNPMSARLVSRTLRAVSQRPFEQFRQLCLQPISKQEIEKYLRSKPMYFAKFPKLSGPLGVIYELEQITPQSRYKYIATINLFSSSNDEPVEYPIIFMFTMTFNSGNFTLDDSAPKSSKYWVKLDEILSWLPNAELDLYTQWQILTHRANCPDMAKMVVQYLKANLNQMRQHVMTLSNQWFMSDSLKNQFMAIGLLFYFQLYLKINADLLLRVPKRQNGYYNPSHLYRIGSLLGRRSSQKEYQQFIQATTDLYNKLLSNIDFIYMHRNEPYFQ